MRIDGKLSEWDDDRGFGFIAGTLGGDDIFVHISVFPKDGQRPKLGEHITFEVEIDPKGKKRAKNLVCTDRSTTLRPKQPERHQPRRHHDKPSWFGRFVPLVIFVALGAYAYNKYNTHVVPQMAISAPSSEQSSTTNFPSSTPLQSSTASFQCDGRKHCSQMTSCSEAKFFLKNCPGVKMDGDGDGIPCEEQFCR